MPSSKNKSLKIHKSKSKKNPKRHLVHLFVLPALLFYVIFAIYPILDAFASSLFSFNGYVRDEFVGLENFSRLFKEHPFNTRFVGALKHNVIFLVLTFIFQLAVSLFLAILVNSVSKGKEAFKVIFFIPKLLAVVVVGFLFNLILNPNTGALNTFLDKLGLDFLAQSWLGDTKFALISIIMVNSWLGIGFFMLIFLAGLQAINPEIQESAKLDGASSFTMLRKITIPMILPSIMIVSILAIIQSFEQFDLIYAMQGSAGGPYYSTDVLATYFYRLAFGEGSGGSLGLGAAVAVILFIIVASVSAISLFAFRRKEIDY